MTRQLEGLLTTLAKCARRRGLLVALLVVIATMNAIAQDTPAPYMNEQGDTIAVSFPPEPGTYDPHQIIVKFARGVLNPSVLCFTIPLAIDSVEQHECQLQGIPSSFKSTLMNQLFHIDSGIILDANLRGAMYAAGGRYLRRMVSANPCSDTFTVARDGDTLPADDFNWMVLIMADGANPVTAVTALRDTSHMERVEMADLDMYGMYLAIPDDLLYNTYQASLHGDGIGADVAWNYQTGNYNVKIAVIDNGLDWRHHDLGSDMGAGKKVSGGWSYTENNKWFEHRADHGTWVGGIIGAFSNNRASNDGRRLVAGICGGWNADKPGGTLGAQMLGFRVSVPGTNTPSSSRIIAAIREASGRSLNYGYGAHLLNLSLGGFYTEAERSAVNYARGNKVTVVAARGNEGNTSGSYPACYDNTWVVSVGAASRGKERAVENSWAASYGNGMDIMAPGNTRGEPGDPSFITTLGYTGDEGVNRESIALGIFDGSSAAAAFATGVAGLLYSEAWEQWPSGKLWMVTLQPEDIEGIIKATSSDRTAQTNFGKNYARGYDPETAWGHLQADSLFERLNEDYHCLHYSVTPTWYGTWMNVGGVFRFENNFVGTRQPIRPGWYRVQRREVRATTWSWQSDFDASAPMFAWGIGGTNGGWSAAHPNYQTPYTDVISGQWGNGLVFGIRHEPDNPITLRTYQYRLLPLTGGLFGPLTPIFPSAPKLNYSVFGKRYFPRTRDVGGSNDGTASVAIGSNDPADELQAAITPNPVRDAIVLRYVTPKGGIVRIVIHDRLGRAVLERAVAESEVGQRVMRIGVENLPSGTYSCTVRCDSEFVMIPLVIAR